MSISCIIIPYNLDTSGTLTNGVFMFTV